MNKIVVITGAMSGIGKSLKEKFLKQNDIVISLDLNAKSDNNKNFKCDVSNEEQVKQIFCVIAEKYKSIDVLINCAGFAVFGATELIPTQKVHDMFNVNYFGILYCIQNAIPLMKSGSNIFNISSACALFALPFRSHYSAVKAAVSMLSFGLRMELHDSKINVTAILPGDIKTNFSNNRVKTLNTNQRYNEKIEKSAKKIEIGENKRMSLEYASKKLFAICNKTKPKSTYIVGNKYKMLNIFNRLLSNNFILKIIRKMF